MKKLLFIALLFCCFSVNLCAQKYHELFYQSSETHSELPFSLRTQAQNLEDFINRFNGYHNAYGERISPNNPTFQTIRSSPNHWRTWRIKIIGSLLDRQLFRQDSSQNWKLIKTLASMDSISIDRSHMSAFLPIEVVISNASISGVIELKYIELEGQRYEWIIDDVHFSSKRSLPIDGITDLEPVSNPNIFLPPNAHGNGFLLLQRKLRENKSMSPYFNEKKESFATFETLLNKSTSISFEPVYFQFRSHDKAAFKVNDDFFIFEVDLK